MITRLLLLLLLSFLYVTGNAQYIAGGEIYYELIGPQKYKVTAHVYRHCEDAPLTGISGSVYGPGSLSRSITFTRTAIKKINDTCDNPCQTANAVSTPGFEKHSFDATVDFNASPYDTFLKAKACFVHFGIRMSGRTLATTHNSGLFYVDAGVNICDTFIKKNNSPVFSMEPKFLAGSYQPLMYSPGPLDTMDYDSLAFSLEPVKSNYQTNLGYLGNFSATIPLTPYCPPNAGTINCRALPNAKPPRGFYFDPSRCQITFTPNAYGEKGYINIRISEYRRDPVKGNMVLIGFTSREMSMEIRPVASNMLPVLQSNLSEVSVCKNTQLPISTIDEPSLPKQTVPDTTYLFWDSGHPRASFVVDTSKRERSAVITFTKDTLTNTFKRGFFTIAAYDRMCNISLSSKTFVYHELPTVPYTFKSQLQTCNRWSYNVLSGDSSLSPKVYGTVTITDSLGKFLYSGAVPGVYTFNTEGKHYIHYQVKSFSNGCNTLYKDSISISNAFPKGILNVVKDTNVCPSHITRLAFEPSKIPGLKTIQWIKNNADTLTTSDSVLADTIRKTTTFKLLLTRNDGCRSETLRNYYIKYKVAQLFQATNITNCASTYFTVTADTSKLKSPVKGTWSINGKDTAVNGLSLVLRADRNMKIKLRAQDDDYCQFADSVIALLADTFSFSLKKEMEDICVDSLLKISTRNISTQNIHEILWIRNGKDTIAGNVQNYQTSYTEKTGIRVVITDYNGCSVSDSVVIDPIINPGVTLPAPLPVCPLTNVPFQPLVTPYLPLKTFTWYKDGQQVSQDSVYTFTGQTSATIGVRVANKNCMGFAEQFVTVFPQPSVSILSAVNYNKLNHIHLSTDKPFASYQWFNGGNNRDNFFWASALGAPGKYSVWCLVTDNNGCRTGDTIDIFTDKFVSVSDLNKENFRIYPNPAEDQLHIQAGAGTHISICSVDGKLVKELKLTQENERIDVSDLSAATYIVEIAGKRILLIKK